MKHYPYIEASLVVEGRNLDLKKLTEELGIIPTETRGLDDWPEAIKNNLDLPAELCPRYVWSISESMDSCKQIKIPINRIIEQIKGKERILLDFCKRYHLGKSLCILIQAEKMNLPETVLPSYIVSYLGKLEMEISFDIYTY